MEDRIPAKIIQRVTPESVLAALVDGVENPFFWTAEISNNNLDAYFGRMDESTLANFASDASNGVSFLDSHNARNLGYGRSLTGSYEQAGEIKRVVSDFYTVPGISFANAAILTYQSTDDFIRAVKNRLTRDVSVGFYGGKSICDVCGQDVWAIDWENWRYFCPHMPGEQYIIDDEIVIATFTVKDARLAEVSAVYAGATPGATIEKAERMAEMGLIPDDFRHKLEVKYRVKLPENKRNWKGISKRDVKMEELEKLLEKVEGETTEDKVRKLLSDNQKLAKEAERGKLLFNDLVDSALSEGTRAMGTLFNQDTYRTMLNNLSIDDIKAMRSQWQAQGDAALANHDPEVKDKKEKQEKVRIIPKGAYNV